MNVIKLTKKSGKFTGLIFESVECITKGSTLYRVLLTVVSQGTKVLISLLCSTKSVDEAAGRDHWLMGWLKFQYPLQNY